MISRLGALSGYILLILSVLWKILKKGQILSASAKHRLEHIRRSRLYWPIKTLNSFSMNLGVYRTKPRSLRFLVNCNIRKPMKSLKCPHIISQTLSLCTFSWQKLSWQAIMDLISCFLTLEEKMREITSICWEIMHNFTLYSRQWMCPD